MLQQANGLGRSNQHDLDGEQMSGIPRHAELCQNCLGRGWLGYAEYMEASECAVCKGKGWLDDGQRKEAPMTYRADALPPKETVNHPSHYNQGAIEVIDAIEDWKMGFNDGNAIKYIARHRAKGKPEEDLRKALWYIARELVMVHHVDATTLATMLQTIEKKA